MNMKKENKAGMAGGAVAAAVVTALMEGDLGQVLAIAREPGVAGVLAALVGALAMKLWFKHIDRDRDGVPDFIDNEVGVRVSPDPPPNEAPPFAQWPGIQYTPRATGKRDTPTAVIVDEVQPIPSGDGPGTGAGAGAHASPPAPVPADLQDTLMRVKALIEALEKRG